MWQSLASLQGEARVRAIVRALASPRDPADAGTLHLLLGRAYEAQGQPDSAIQAYSDASVLSSSLWEYGMDWEAKLLEQQGRSAQALPLWRRLFAATPQPSFRLEAARAILEDLPARGAEPEAIPCAEALHRAAPSDPEWIARLAVLYEDSGRRAEAESMVRDLWIHRPTSRQTQELLSRRPEWRGWVERLPPADQLVHLRSLAETGQWAELRRELPAFIPSSPSEAGWRRYLAGRLLEARGRLGDAAKDYAGLEIPPEAAAASKVRLGMLTAAGALSGKSAAAAEAGLLGLPADTPGRGRSLLALMRRYDREGDEGKAVRTAEALLAGGFGQTSAGEYLYESGWHYVMAGKRDRADGLWRVLVRALPPSSDYRSAAAYSLIRLGRVSGEEAAALRLDILREDRYGYFGYRVRGGPPAPDQPAPPPPAPAPVQPGSHAAKGFELLRCGLLPEAGGEFEMASRAADDPGTQWAMARAMAEADDYTGAIRSLRRLYPNAFGQSGDSVPAEAWRILFPRPFWPQVRTAASTFDLPVFFVCSVIRQESLWDPDALSASGAVGLMQLLPGTARAVARKFDLKHTDLSRLRDPAWNALAGCAYMTEMLKRYGGQVHLALAAYNAGPGRVDEWLRRPGCPKDPDLFIESIPFRETRSYVRRILLNQWEYGRLYADGTGGAVGAEAHLFMRDAQPARVPSMTP
ncbi:MAG: transglycosylase SLT domain-containing protein [Acidobacteriota bacterium]